MSAPIEIWTSGDIAFLEVIFTGIGHMFENSFVMTGIMISFILNLFYGIMSGILSKGQPNLLPFVQALMIWLIFFSSEVKVSINKVNVGSRVIAGEFPVGLVFPAHLISTFGVKMADEFRINIIPVDTGLGFTTSNVFLENGITPIKALLEMRRVRIGAVSTALNIPGSAGDEGSGLQGAITDYITQCMEKYSLLEEFNGAAPSNNAVNRMFELSWTSNSPWEKLKVPEPGWPFITSLSGQPLISNCSDGWQEINQALNYRADQMSKVFMTRGLSTNLDAKSMADQLMNIEAVAIALDPNVGAAAMGVMAKTQWVSELASGACKDSALLGLDQVQSCRAQYDAIQERRFAEAGKSDAWGEMVLPMVTFVEGFIYALMPVMVFVAITAGAAGLGMVIKYMTAIVWVGLMPVCQVLVDAYLNVYFNKFLISIKTDVSGSTMFSPNSMSNEWTELESFVAFAGTAQAMVPALAMFVLFAGVHAMQGLAGGMANGGVGKPGANHANQGATVQDDTVKYGNQGSTLTTGANGETIVKSSSSNVAQAQTADVQLSSGGSTALTSNLAEAKSQATSAGNAYKHASNDAVQDNVMSGKKWSFADASAAGLSVDQSATAATIQQAVKNGSIDQATARQLTTAMGTTQGMSVSGGFSGSVNNKDSAPRDKGSVVSGGVNAGVNASYSLSAEQKEAQSQLETFKNSEVYAKAYNENLAEANKASNSVGTGSNVTDSADESVTRSTSWGKAVEANTAYQEATNKVESLSRVDSSTMNASVSSDSVNQALSNDDGAKAIFSGEKHMNAGRASLAEGFLSKDGSEMSREDQSVVDKIRNGQKLSDDQAQHLESRMTTDEAKVMSNFGYDADKNGFMAHGDFLNKITGDGEASRLALGSDSQLSEADSQALISKVMLGVNDLANSGGTTLASDDALKAGGEIFKSMADESNGYGDNARGGLGNLGLYGDSLVRMGDVASDGKFNELSKPNVDTDSLKAIEEHGENYDRAPLLKDALKTNGGSTDLSMKETIKQQNAEINETKGKVEAEHARNEQATNDGKTTHSVNDSADKPVSESIKESSGIVQEIKGQKDYIDKTIDNASKVKEKEIADTVGTADQINHLGDRTYSYSIDDMSKLTSKESIESADKFNTARDSLINKEDSLISEIGGNSWISDPSKESASAITNIRDGNGSDADRETLINDLASQETMFGRPVMSKDEATEKVDSYIESSKEVNELKSTMTPEAIKLAGNMSDNGTNASSSVEEIKANLKDESPESNLINEVDSERRESLIKEAN
ncbi:hypothetical protein EIJ81_00495 (plasmid) [Aliivibrio salmonicida]|uniref:conjugal transfer protein TraG N-terminal domain-containing protein n=1 Tax=Aliivibrio salmonicida TaxID=40269 RepID=UPI000F6ED2E8|nr:conjugal transfer protein TraG N-terminal domain-containing protein [Aliivibrio salmonicida]AZL83378.1 hypothetical protein EIJ81_00495 [Aliivibrio salmonicida]